MNIKQVLPVVSPPWSSGLIIILRQTCYEGKPWCRLKLKLCFPTSSTHKQQSFQPLKCLFPAVSKRASWPQGGKTVTQQTTALNELTDNYGDGKRQTSNFQQEKIDEIKMPPTRTDPEASAETVFLIVTLEPVRFMSAPTHLKSFVHPQPSQSVCQRD